MKTKQKREERAKLVADARKIIDGVPDGQSMTGEQEQEFDRIMAAADKLKKEIDKLEALDDAETDLNNRVQRRAGRENISEDEAKAKLAFESKTFKHFLRFGTASMDADMKAVALPRISNAQGTAPDTAGGYLVPIGFYGQIISAQLAFGGMFDMAGPNPICTIIDTETGNPLPIPTDDDTSNEGALLGENTQVSEQGVTFGAVEMGAYTYTSKLIRVSNQLLQDSAFDLNSFLAGKMGMRLARIQNRHLTVGNGSGKPTGVVTAATSAATTGSATDITPDETIDLAHSVDPAYRTGARYMFNDSTLKVLKKKKDGEGRYLWTSGLQFKEPDSINGYSYTINQHFDSIATGNKAMAFGQFSNYFIRRAGGIMVRRLDERYADYNQTAFVAFQRVDGNLIDAGTHPVKYLLQA